MISPVSRVLLFLLLLSLLFLLLFNLFNFHWINDGEKGSVRHQKYIYIFKDWKLLEESWLV